MQKLNRYLLQTDEQRVEYCYPSYAHGRASGSVQQRRREKVFKLLECNSCGWSIDPTIPHWEPDSGYDGGIYHIECYKPTGYSKDLQSRQGWQCFCGHQCKCENYLNKTGYLGADCERCENRHHGNDTNYDYSQVTPHECMICGWEILPIETPILNKDKNSHDYPTGWMHDCCYDSRYEELKLFDKEYKPITLVMPQGNVVEVEMFDDMTDGQLEQAKETASDKQWERSIQKQTELVEELRIWNSFGVERVPI